MSLESSRYVLIFLWYTRETHLCRDWSQMILTTVLVNRIYCLWSHTVWSVLNFRSIISTEIRIWPWSAGVWFYCLWAPTAVTKKTNKVWGLEFEHDFQKPYFELLVFNQFLIFLHNSWRKLKPVSYIFSKYNIILWSLNLIKQ